MRILLVEPDQYYHSRFSDSVSDLGELLIATSAGEAMKIMDEQAPDILVMELVLPDQSGYRVLEEIKRRQEPLPVIIYSRADNLEDVQASLNFGVVSFFVKGRDTINDIRKLILVYGL